ncbi:hypothetical protein M433DRAFT_64604 [Acidomyces richmondensis BFW]|nr:MAG: hypothetical protein FE78DRAFT_147936 [Acidomyces sp. 'richmondensis']KYG46713.1 hypothetical protein M433DRAFT_64604 [Acidomyces richmondensis BFW]
MQQTPPNLQHDGTDRARAYKSRNKRPCDFCRYKKAACHLESHPPCELCIRYNKECTFVESPAKRRRPNENNTSKNLGNGAFDQGPQSNGGEPKTPFLNRAMSGHQHQSSMDTSPSSQGAYCTANVNLPFDATSGEPSLDNQASSNAQIVGISGEADPYLLARYRYDRYNEAKFQSIRIRKMNEGFVDDDSIPAFFTIAHNALASKAQPMEKTEVLDRYRRELENMVSDDVGKRLIRLFYKYVQPYFPILTREGRRDRDEDGVRKPCTIATCILAAIYGHALPFCAWDEKLCVEVYTPPSPDALFQIAWLAVQPLLHTPSLAALQTLLLMVQRRPTNKYVSDTPMKSVMMSTAVSIAQALGLNRDPTYWPLPNWEIKVRRRLAWATFVQDKWLALNSGRGSYIQSDEWDLEPLTEDDFADADREGPAEPPGFGGQQFIKLCELTLIVDDITHKLFSLKATKTLHASLEGTLEVAKPLRIRITDWYQSLPFGLLPRPNPNSPDSSRRPLQHELDGHGSLHLAYITAKIELFRAMLRPRSTDTNQNAVTALRTGALSVAKEIFEFLEGLNAQELEAFWASYSRSNFTIASSFILLLFVTSPTLADAKECLTLLYAWRSLLRVKSRSCDLLNLALLRLDGVFVAGMETLIELSPAATQAWIENGLTK